eukprot:521665_1
MKQYIHGINNYLHSALYAFGAFDLMNASYPFLIDSMSNTICAVQGLMISNNKRLQAIKEQQLIRVELAICFAMLPINDYTVYISILMDKLQYRSQNDKGDMIDMEHELRQKMNQSQLIRFYKKVIVSFETSKSFFIRGGIGKYSQFTSDGDLNPQFMDSNRNELQRVTNCNANLLFLYLLS